MKFIIQHWLLLLLLLLIAVGPLAVLFTNQVNLQLNWRNASRISANLAPKPEVFKPAVIQVYVARTYSWRGLFATHTWIALKPQGAKYYTVYQVVGWLAWRGLPVLSIAQDVPDRLWFGYKPILIKDIRGDKAEQLIPQVEQAARHYPYANEYHFWPGPNSNTFPAYVARYVPELNLALPAIAIGKDYLGLFKFWARAPSGTGWQISLWGMLGVLIARDEGLEINVLGLVYGINWQNRALILPGVGEVGLD